MFCGFYISRLSCFQHFCWFILACFVAIECRGGAWWVAVPKLKINLSVQHTQRANIFSLFSRRAANVKNLIIICASVWEGEKKFRNTKSTSNGSQWIFGVSSGSVGSGQVPKFSSHNKHKVTAILVLSPPQPHHSWIVSPEGQEQSSRPWVLHLPASPLDIPLARSLCYAIISRHENSRKIVNLT